MQASKQALAASVECVGGSVMWSDFFFFRTKRANCTVFNPLKYAFGEKTRGCRREEYCNRPVKTRKDERIRDKLWRCVLGQEASNVQRRYAYTGEVEGKQSRWRVDLRSRDVEIPTSHRCFLVALPPTVNLSTDFFVRGSFVYSREKNTELSRSVFVAFILPVHSISFSWWKVTSVYAMRKNTPKNVS